MKISLSLLICFSVCITLSNGCHNYHHRRKRQSDEGNEMSKIEKTRDLRNYFADCMDRMTQDAVLSWRSVVDFTILDTNWYFSTNENNCSDLYERDTAECWKSRLPDIIDEHLPIINYASNCVDEYATGFPPPNCSNGRWSRFFNDDSPQTGEGDFEGFSAKFRQYGENILCGNPTDIDVRLTNGADYRTAGQTVSLAAEVGFACSNSDQKDGIQCHDYMVRFCCPVEPERVIKKRQADFAFSTSQKENQLFERCLLESITLPSNRRSLNYSSVIKLAENYLICNRNSGGDCSLRLNETAQKKDILLQTWSYILEAVTRQRSPLASGIATCNQQIFPPQLITERVASGGRGWSVWGSWGHCPARCGESGERLRRRYCIGGPPKVYPCIGRLHHSEPCQPLNCDIRWSNWNQWSPCANNLPTTYRERSRNCINSDVGIAGNCLGSNIQRESCGADIGNLHRNLSPWAVIGPCQGKCGHNNAVERRQRFCKVGPNGSPGCAPPYKDTQVCTLQCGHWGTWMTNSPCTLTCGSGTRTRQRQCIGGKVGEPGCSGPSFMTVRCNIRPCPTQNKNANGWSEWGNWEQCRAQCNQRTQQARRRFCKVGPVGGPGCPGSDVDMQGCTNRCGTWSNWTQFSKCAGKCGISTKSRTRSCEGGTVGQPNCYGNSIETHQCWTGRPC